MRAPSRGPVVLIGPMGSGKTSVGRALARLLGGPWVDLDESMERRFGRSVARQFRVDGEAVFRRREGKMLREACRSGAGVVSAGGGVVLASGNRALLRRQRTVYLKASPAVLWERLKRTPVDARPLLRGAGEAEAVLRRLARLRGPLYRSCASVTVLAAQGSAVEVARRVARRLAVLTRRSGPRILKKY